MDLAKAMGLAPGPDGIGSEDNVVNYEIYDAGKSRRVLSGSRVCAHVDTCDSGSGGFCSRAQS
jgi:hypothetical protein